MNSYRLLLVLMTLFCSGLHGWAKDTKRVKGTYQYVMPSDITLEEARMIAIERAKLDALEREFGTNISLSNSTLMNSENDRTKTSFYSLGESEVRGQWLKTHKEEVEEQIVDGQHIVRARVEGEACEVTFAKVNFETHLLRNGTGDEFESEEFRDGDRFYISFLSPAKGYLAIFLLDAERNAFRIVPHGSGNDGELHPIKRGQRYVFDDDKQNHLILTTDRQQEIDQVYVIFSPHKFYCELDLQNTDNSDLNRYKQGEYTNLSHLPYIPFEAFQKWIVRLRKSDPEVQVVTRFIKIIGKE